MMFSLTLFLKVTKAPTSVSEAVKTTICPKVSVAWMEKSFYSPACAHRCSALACGNNCEIKHEVSLI
jgi:endogenous inhibitor of DNA gyrase (YacG/DUF329 family)